MRLYGLLLHFYPAAFRVEYGEEMCGIFARQRRDAEGVAGVAALWLRTFFEIFLNAAAVHADILRQDLRYTVRTLGRSRGFALTAVLVVALGVGANTAVFSLVDHVLIRPLPFADADRLVKLWENHPGYSRVELSPPNYRDWKNMSHSFENLAAFTSISHNLVGRGEPERVVGAAGDVLSSDHWGCGFTASAAAAVRCCGRRSVVPPLGLRQPHPAGAAIRCCGRRSVFHHWGRELLRFPGGDLGRSRTHSSGDGILKPDLRQYRVVGVRN